MDEDEISVTDLKYDGEEVERRRNLVIASPNLYLCKKKSQLRDAVIITKKKIGKSVTDLCGIRLKEKNAEEFWFFCLMGTCFHTGLPIKITKLSTYNATKHLSCKHNIQAAKTEAHQRNVAQLNKQIEGADDQFKNDPTRWFEVNLAAFACENSLAYRAFESNTWKVIANKLPVGNNRNLQRVNIRKIYVEHYITIKEHIMFNIAEA